MNATHIVMNFAKLVQDFLNSSNVQQFKANNTREEYLLLLKQLKNEVTEHVR